MRRWSIIIAGIGVAAAGTGAALALTAPDNPDGCLGACATGTGLMIGGGVVTVTGLALLLASFGEPANSRVSATQPLQLRF